MNFFKKYLNVFIFLKLCENIENFEKIEKKLSGNSEKNLKKFREIWEIFQLKLENIVEKFFKKAWKNFNKI